MDQNIVHALLHHVNVIFTSDDPGNLGREQELDNIKKCIGLAERIVAGKASDEEKAKAADLVHPSVRTTYGL